MVLTGRRVKAQEGYEMGFVSIVVPGGAAEVVAAALDFAEQVMLGRGRIVALRCRPSTSHQICSHIWRLYF